MVTQDFSIREMVKMRVLCTIFLLSVNINYLKLKKNVLKQEIGLSNGG